MKRKNVEDPSTLSSRNRTRKSSLGSNNSAKIEVIVIPGSPVLRSKKHSSSSINDPSRTSADVSERQTRGNSKPGKRYCQHFLNQDIDNDCDEERCDLAVAPQRINCSPKNVRKKLKKCQFTQTEKDSNKHHSSATQPSNNQSNKENITVNIEVSSTESVADANDISDKITPSKNKKTRSVQPTKIQRNEDRTLHTETRDKLGKKRNVRDLSGMSDKASSSLNKKTILPANKDNRSQSTRKLKRKTASANCAGDPETLSTNKNASPASQPSENKNKTNKGNTRIHRQHKCHTTNASSTATHCTETTPKRRNFQAFSRPRNEAAAERDQSSRQSQSYVQGSSDLRSRNSLQEGEATSFRSIVQRNPDIFETEICFESEETGVRNSLHSSLPTAGRQSTLSNEQSNSEVTVGLGLNFAPEETSTPVPRNLRQHRKRTRSRGARSSHPINMSSAERNILSSSPDPVAQVRQIEEDERMARDLQAQFDLASTAQCSTHHQNNSHTRTASRARRGSHPTHESRQVNGASTRTAHAPVLPSNWDEVVSNFLQFFSTLMDETEPLLLPGGLERHEISSLPSHKYEPAIGVSNNTSAAARSSRTESKNTSTTLSEETNECLVCLCDYKSNDLLRVLPCLHEYHAKCIDEWLKRNRTCPVCRAEVSFHT